MIRFEHVTKEYGKSGVKAVDDLNLLVERGKVFGFIGPNGAGKTTSIRLMTGILAPTSGRVLIGGMDMAKDPVDAKRMIGFVPDGHELYDRLTGLEYLRFLADIYGVEPERRKAHIEKYLALFELEQAAGDPIRSYSRGMKQKLTVIGALIHKPPVWVLDEPMVGLDPAAIKELKEMVLELKSYGVTILISTHMLEMVKELWDVMFIMERGRIIGTFTREQAKDADIEDLFFQITGGGEAS